MDPTAASPEFPVRPRAGVVFRMLDDGGVLVHLSNNRVFELNTTGATIWDLVARGAGEAEVLDALVDAFDVDRDTARRECRELLAALVREGLVEP